MFLPIGDEPNARRAAVVNYALIAANVVVFLLVSLPQIGHRVALDAPGLRQYLEFMVRDTGASPQAILAQTSAYQLFIFEHGFKPGAPALGDLFFSLFLHAGWMHLLGNMLFLWIFGDNVEHRIGRVGYLLLYLGTGALATLFFALFSWGSMVPLIGASGAISGVLGAYFLWFPRNRVRVLIWLFIFVDIVRLPARWVLGFYLLVDNLLPFLFGRGESGVAHGAHIGGFFAGLGAAWLLENWSQRDALLGRWKQRAPRAVDDGASDDAVERLTALAAAGRWDEVVRIYAAMTIDERQRLRDADIFGMTDWLAEVGRGDTALAVLQRYIATHPTGDGLASAHLRAGLLQLHERRQPTAAYQHFLAVLDIDPRSRIADAAREAIADIEARRFQRTLH